jgi:hypothetical protein
MNDVKRYSPDIDYVDAPYTETGSRAVAVMSEANDGGWVAGHDYDALIAARDALAAQLRARGLSPAPCDVCGYNGPGYYQPATHPCAAPVPPSQEAREESVPASIVAGALFDFAGFLTTRDTAIRVGASENAAHVVDALRRFASMRLLPLDNAAVISWQRQFVDAAILAAKEKK